MSVSLLAAATALSAALASPAAEQVRLVFGPDCTSTFVHFATNNVSTPVTYVPTVQYGTSPSGLTSSVTGYSSNYTIYKILSPVLHFVNLTALTCNQQYFYRVGDGVSTWSDVLNFTTSPKAGDKSAYPVRFAAYADMGISNSQATADAVTNLAIRGDISFVVHAGDISYADDRAGVDNGSHYDGILSQFYNEVMPYSSLVQYMSSSGNHERLGDGTDFKAYLARVGPSLPWQAVGGSPFWYSFNYGPVHFVAFDIDQEYSEDSAQYAWIKSDLQQVDRAITPWVVAFSHFPMACTNFFWCLAESGPAKFRELYEPIFNAPETKVDVFLSGHVHAAEVLYPQINQTLVQNNFTDIQQTLHVMTGFPGDMEVCCNDWAVPKPNWSYWRDDDVAKDGGFFGFSRFTIYNDTHLELQVYNSGNQTVVLDLVVSRKYPF